MAKAVKVESADLIRLGGCSVAMGVYDGLHLGHQAIIEQMCASQPEVAKRAILTFDVDPEELFCPTRLKKLMTNASRLQALAQLPVGTVYVFPFTRDFAAKTPHEFLEEFFSAQVPQALYVGSDFRFGCKGQGRVADLHAWGDARGMDVHAVELLCMDGLPVTSTRIRGALKDGDPVLARRLLGRPFAIEACVERGRQQGADWGFATANLRIPPERLCLADGVYGGYATIDGAGYRCAISVGVSPTVGQAGDANAEVHLIGFSGDLYGRQLSCQILCYIRPMLAFSSKDELIATVMDNIAWVRDEMPL